MIYIDILSIENKFSIEVDMYELEDLEAILAIVNFMLSDDRFNGGNKRLNAVWSAVYEQYEAKLSPH